MNYNSISAFTDGISRQQGIPHTVSRKKTLSVCVAAALVACSSIMAIEDADAADSKRKSKNKIHKVDVVNELQAENARLREQLEQLQAAQKVGATSGTGAIPATSATSTIGAETPDAATTEPAEVVAQAEVEETKDLGEVVVSGRRAKPLLEKLHDVKQSESIISGKDLDKQLVQDLGGITRRASNVQFNQNNTRGASLSVRGVGKRSFTETQDPSVGITVDNVSYGLSQLANFSFYDVDNAVVTRGPRGTEGGLSASSGKVIITSKAPTFTPTADLSVAYGQQETLVIKGALGGAVVDDLLAWRGSFIVDKAKGYYGQEYDSNYSLYNRDRLSGRMQLLFTPTSTITTRLMADFEPKQPQLQNGLNFYHAQPQNYANGSLVDPNGAGSLASTRLYGFTNTSGAFTGPRAYFQGRGFNWNDYIGGEARKTVWFDQNKGQTVSNQGASLQTDWSVADHVLSSITAVRQYRFDAHNDEYTPFDINVDNGGGVNYSQYTQEIKIKNNLGGFFDYKAGLFGMKTNDTIDSKNGWGSDAGAWFATNAQYNILDKNAGTNRGAGLALLKDSLQDARVKQATKVSTLSGAIFGEGELHFTDKFSLIPGLRVTKEHRETADNRIVTANGAGSALNPVAVRGVQTGGFNSNATGVLGANSATQLQLADSVANRYFGTAITNTAGAAYNSLTAAQKTQIGTAKTVRANQIGQLYNTANSEYDAVLFTGQFTPTYKINDDLTTYVSWQYGQKSGSAIVTNGLPDTVKPEETNAAELGLKSFWLDKKVIVNVDTFIMDIKNYQQTVQVVDQFSTNQNIANGVVNPLAYTAAQGNVNKVRVHGVELDSVFNLIPDLSLRLNGAYNIAKYVDYKNAAKPEELAYLPGSFVDMSGKTLPGASKWSFVVGADYSKPFYNKYVFHTSVTTNFQSGYNNTDNLSVYGTTNPRSLTDLAVGVGTKNNILDASFIVKNLFNNNEHEQGWNSYSPYPYPVWYGVQLSAKM
ncbi:TonB-dependent receptor plug domain-containing protein [Methylobacter sp. S3L5C]|uniref:TonB-dependent receptor plug domain-containing protein n=1 Tax=Methylobacter sp. S3L5C TaxID=2839024 RepID=UPI001FABFA43|nr:TonB-dependent receptor plug domain-containing protein [Methylobacter sp. S3L5C]UOA10108.1 TonB-dependent receptor [Methylobacter sp. S3L5C]